MGGITLLKYFIKLSASNFLVFCLLIVSLNTAQSQEEEKKQKEGFYSQLVRAVVRLEEHQSICTPGRDWASQRDVPVGSAFFIRDRFPGEGDAEINRYFLVTARHVVEHRADLFARVQAGPGSAETIVLRLPRQLWVFHGSSIQEGKFPIDVAVMTIPYAPFLKAFLHCMSNENPDGCGTNEETKQLFKNQVGDPPIVMDRAIFFGFPTEEVAKQGVEPLARAGIVAYTATNPDLKISGRPLIDDSVFLVDAPAFPGNSGGPVIKEPLPLRSEVKVWGLVTGGHVSGRDYAIVTSVERIRETLVYARSIAKLDTDAWQRDPPQLRLKCAPD